MRSGFTRPTTGPWSYFKDWRRTDFRDEDDGNSALARAPPGAKSIVTQTNNAMLSRLHYRHWLHFNSSSPVALSSRRDWKALNYV
ncbi:hypothetical protein RRG08_055986 [Elysia crispata]|uniref:Uncharacterized protein n=1 Tax=Elysia crispata TaxID=231223 RepID=A0AAE1AG06_9GAST|nr:hypothetical protein RRG08_055986 [Elysia crispata]